MSGITTAAIIAGTVGAAGSVASGVIGAHAAGSAANAQSKAAQSAAQLQYQAGQNALDFQKQQYAQGYNTLFPYAQLGTSGLVNLANLLGIFPGSYSTQGGNPPVANTGATGRNAGPYLPGAGVPPTAGVPGLPGATTGGGTNGGTPAIVPGGNAQNGNLPPIGADQIKGGSQDQQPWPFNVAGNGKPTGNNINLSQNPGPYTPGQLTLSNGQTITLPQIGDLGSYVNPSLGASGSLLTPWTQQFEAPTDVTEQNDPGYQFRLNEGEKALQRSAAASGNLLAGGTQKALARYGQDYASNEYNNVYNRALGQYQQNYNIFQNNQANTFNRLAALAGIGQVGANQLNSAGLTTAGNVGNILLGTAGQIGQQLNNAGAARASGYIGGANAINGAISGGTGGLTNALLLSQLFGGGGGYNFGANPDPYFGQG